MALTTDDTMPKWHIYDKNRNPFFEYIYGTIPYIYTHIWSRAQPQQQSTTHTGSPRTQRTQEESRETEKGAPLYIREMINLDQLAARK